MIFNHPKILLVDNVGKTFEKKNTYRLLLAIHLTFIVNPFSLLNEIARKNPTKSIPNFP